MTRGPDPREVRDAVAEVGQWLRDDGAPKPERSKIAVAVRLTARALAARAPGSSVEVRVPPFVAVQCISGPRHTRGTPPNVVETDPRTWLLLTAGLVAFDRVVAEGRLGLSGSRAGEIGSLFPLVSLPPPEEP